MRRGSLYEDQDDPEFQGQRVALGVSGFAIFYLPHAYGGGVYVSSIKPWDFPDLPERP